MTLHNDQDEDLTFRELAVRNLEPKDQLTGFIKWLTDHDLTICNFTKRNVIYWPVGNTDWLIDRYLKEKS